RRVAPKQLANSPLHAVSHRRRSHLPPHGQPQARPLQLVAGNHELEAAAADSQARAPHSIELGLISNAIRTGETLGAGALSPVANDPPRATSNREALAALLPSAAQDRPASPGAHSDPESVGPLPPAVVRLKCPLHRLLTLLASGTRTSPGTR